MDCLLQSFKTQYEQLNKSLLATKEKQEQEVKDANKKTRELELRWAVLKSFMWLFIPKFMVSAFKLIKTK